MILKGGASFVGDTDGQRWEILRSQDYLIEGPGTEVGGNAVCLIKKSLSADVEKRKAMKSP